MINTTNTVTPTKAVRSQSRVEGCRASASKELGYFTNCSNTRGFLSPYKED